MEYASVEQSQQMANEQEQRLVREQKADPACAGLSYKIDFNNFQVVPKQENLFSIISDHKEHSQARFRELWARL